MEKTLLLVDDEENVIKSLRRLFRQEPFKVLTASSGQEGLDILAQQRVEVILSDQRMPGMIGSDFFKIVKERYPETIRIVMSGYTELESITSAINDGAVFKFLLKPWDDTKLISHIRDAFAYHSLKSSNLLLTEELKKLNTKLEERVQEELEKNALHTRSLILSQELLDRVPVAVFGISNEGMVVMANQYARLLIAHDAIIGNTIEDLMPESIAENLKTLLLSRNDDSIVELNWPGTNKVAKITPIFNSAVSCLCLSIV